MTTNRLFGASMSRPDKREPMLMWFTNAQAARRTLMSAIELTARDYGALGEREALMQTGGYARAMDWLREKTGESRIEASIKMLDVPKETAKALEITINLAPQRIASWPRARRDQFDYWLGAPRARMPTGVDRYYARRREKAQKRQIVL